MKSQCYCLLSNQREQSTSPFMLRMWTHDPQNQKKHINSHKENHTVVTLWKPFLSGLDRFFFWFPSKKAVLHNFIQAGKRSSRDLAARQGLISITKHKRPISSEDLEVLYVAYQLGLNTSEILANSAWFNTLLYFGKRGRENPREMKPGDRLLLVVYEFFSCSANIPRGLSAYNP